MFQDWECNGLAPLPKQDAQKQRCRENCSQIGFQSALPATRAQLCLASPRTSPQPISTYPDYRSRSATYCIRKRLENIYYAFLQDCWSATDKTYHRLLIKRFMHNSWNCTIFIVVNSHFRSYRIYRRTMVACFGLHAACVVELAGRQQFFIGVKGKVFTRSLVNTTKTVGHAVAQNFFQTRARRWYETATVNIFLRANQFFSRGQVAGNQGCCIT